MNIDLKGIGLRISERRKHLGFTQEQLAEKIDVSVQMISNLERGNKAIKVENLIKISETLNISTDYILTGKHTKDDADIWISSLHKLNETDKEMIEMIIDFCKNKSN